MVERQARTPTQSERQVIVPAKAINELHRLLEDGPTLQIHLKENQITFDLGKVQLISRLIEGKFPNYEQVIPKDNDKFAIVDKSALASAVRRMAVVASDQTHRIRMAFESDRVHLTVLTPDLGEGEDELELTYEGEGIEIGFNAAYLLDVLKYMSTDEVKITLKAPERAATIEPVPAEGEEAEDYLCLVMPLRLLD